MPSRDIRTIPKDLAEKLIDTKTVASLKEDIKEFSKCVNGKELRAFLMGFGISLSYPVYPFFGEQLDNLILTGDTNTFYFEVIASQVSEFLSVVSAIVSMGRERYEREITTEEYSVKKTEAGTSARL